MASSDPIFDQVSRALVQHQALSQTWKVGPNKYWAPFEYGSYTFRTTARRGTRRFNLANAAGERRAYMSYYRRHPDVDPFGG